MSCGSYATQRARTPDQQTPGMSCGSYATHRARTPDERAGPQAGLGLLLTRVSLALDRRRERSPRHGLRRTRHLLRPIVRQVILTLTLTLTLTLSLTLALTLTCDPLSGRLF